MKSNQMINDNSLINRNNKRKLSKKNLNYS